MDIRFSGKNLTITAGIREHLREKIMKFEKYAPRLVESHVILKKQKYLYDAQITLHAKNFQAIGEGVGKENIYAAIDQACERVEKQLKKFREKIKDHHKEHGGMAVPPKVKTARRVLAEGDLSLRRPSVIKSPDFAQKPMSIDEASLQLELSKESFLVFRNAVTRKVNVIYKREDANHGLIEPEF